MQVRLSQIILIFIGAIFVGLAPIVAIAQDMRNSSANRYGNMSTLGGNPYDTGIDPDDPDGKNIQKPDTTKPKVRKPLESYFFNDSTRKRPNFVWNVNMYRNNITQGAIDTALNLHQIDLPYQLVGVGDAYLGQLGGASIPLDYLRRPQYRNNEFASAFNSYYFTPENVKFYNVKLPFTHLNYLMSGQKKYYEENFGITHAQNASPSTGFNIDYKSRGARGIYAWQKARDKNLSMAFSHTGKKYTAHAGYIYNSVEVRENGGITEDRFVTDTVFELPENIPTRLSDARNKIKNNTFFAIQSYGIPLRKLTDEDFSIAKRSTIFIGHAIEYSRWYKKYTDTRPDTLDYYKHWYINSTQSNDSIFESTLSNRLFLQIQPWDREGTIGLIDAGVGMDNHHYYQFDMNQYLSGNTKGVDKTSYYAYGAIEGNIKRYFSWSGNIRFHPFGYRSGDLTVGGNASISAFIKDKPITLSGRFNYELRSPGYWTDGYFSNHYAWSNSFAKENETRIELALNIPSIGLELGANQSVISNKIYYDAESLPAQHTGSVSLSSLYARKDFRLGGFHLNHRVLLQWSTSQEVIPVPLASAFISYYFEFNVVKNVLRVQTGLDARYNTRYYAFGYNPALAQFYNQREKQIGEYPMIDAFVSAKWKRMRILAKFAHVNDDLIGGRNYFTVLHYPQNKRILKLGFSWSFYD